MRKKNIIITLTILISILFAQEFKLQFSFIPTGQGFANGDSNKVLNSIGGSFSQESSSDSIKVGDGFLKSSQNVFSEPPEISIYNFPSIINKSSEGVQVEAEVFDLNGIKSANLHVQVGGHNNEIIIPMTENQNNIFQTIIHDTLIDIANFRARVFAEDNLGFISNSLFKTGSINFKNNEMTMSHKNSYYPSGIQKNSWRLISWPGIPSNLSLAESNLNEGHVFYKYDPLSNEYIIPKSIELGTGYWFKHNYKEAVIFDEDTSTSIPLENYVVNLKPGWNIIGSPFSFPVSFKKDSTVGSLITFGIANKNGWSAAQNILEPWNGYAVFSANNSSITLIPFYDDNQSRSRTPSLEEWSLNIKVESESFFNYMTVIGRKEFAKNLTDTYDIPSPKFLENKLSIVTSLDSKNSYHYISDFRSTADFNGVWDLRLNAELGQKNIFISTSENSFFPEGLYFSLVDIQNKSINYEIIKTGSVVKYNSDLSLDYKIVSGDKNYVTITSEKILENIPDKYFLSQNYPNPFNPKTKLDYELPKRSNIQILIYNVLGQQVKILINKEQNYGSHSIFWDGLDQLGNEVSTGVYFARMTTSSFTQTKKMLLLK